MARLNLTYQNLYDRVSHFLGLTTEGTSPTGTNLTKCQGLVQRGIRNWLYPVDEMGRPVEWSFLQFPISFTTSSDKWKYALPIDFSEMLGTLHYDSSYGNPPLQKRSAEQILELRADVTETGYPYYFAITTSQYDPEVGTVYELWLYPQPNQAYNLSGFYRADPVQLSATTDLMVGGVRAAESILESCLAEAEVQEDDTIGIHSQRAREMILRLIKYDRITKTGKIGNLYSGVDGAWPRPRQYFTYPNMSNVYDGDSGADIL